MLANLVVTIHVLTVLWFVAGAVGRNLCHHRAARASSLAEAIAADTITPALRAALNDRAVALARHYENLMIPILTWLMVAKPF